MKNNNFKDFFYNQPFPIYIEMAQGQGNISGFRKLFDDDDLRYLHHFPLELWPQALQWRYGEGMMRAAEARHEGQPYIGEQEIKLKLKPKGKEVYIFTLDPQSEKFIQHMEEPSNAEEVLGWDKEASDFPSGGLDYDLSRPQRARNEKGEIRTDPEARHTVASLFTMAKGNVPKYAIRTWLWGSASGVLGEPREEFDGQPTEMHKLVMPVRGGDDVLDLPAVRKKLEYKVYANGKIKNVAKEEWLPVLNSGKLTKPMQKFGLREVFNIPVETKLSQVDVDTLGNTEYVLNTLKERLGLTDARAEDVKEWLNTTPEKTLETLEKYLNYEHVKEWKARRIAQLKDFSKLSPERQQAFKTHFHTGHEAKAFHDPDYNIPRGLFLIGGWQPQALQPRRTPCLDMTLEEKKLIQDRWTPKYIEEAKKAKNKFVKNLAGKGKANEFIASEMRENEGIETQIAMWLALNMCDPKVGLGNDTKAALNRGVKNGVFSLDNLSDSWLKKKGQEWRAFAKNQCEKLKQKDWGQGTRRLRQDIGMQSVDQQLGGEGEGEGISFLDLGPTEIKNLITGVATSEDFKGLPRNLPGEVEFAKHLEEIRRDFATEDEKAALEARRINEMLGALIRGIHEALYDKYFKETNDAEQAVKLAGDSLPQVLKEKGVTGNQELINQQIANVEKSATEESELTPEEQEQLESFLAELESLKNDGLAELGDIEINVLDLENLGPQDKIPAAKYIIGSKIPPDAQWTRQEFEKYLKKLVQTTLIHIPHGEAVKRLGDFDTEFWPAIQKYIYGSVGAPSTAPEAPAPTTVSGVAEIPYDQHFKGLQLVHQKMQEDAPGTFYYLKKNEDQLKKLAQMMHNHPDPQKRTEAIKMLQDIGEYWKSKLPKSTATTESVASEAEVVMGSGPYKKWKHKDFNAWGAAGDPMGVSPDEGPIGVKKKKKKKKKKVKEKIKEHIEKLRLKPYRDRLEEKVKNELGKTSTECSKHSS
jgi:hypothetical protein